MGASSRRSSRGAARASRPRSAPTASPRRRSRVGRLRGAQEDLPRDAHRGLQARVVLPHRARRRLRRLRHAHDAPCAGATSTSSTAPSASSPTAATPTGSPSTPRRTRTPATAGSPASSCPKDDTVTVDKKEDKMGQRASNTATITFNETEIPRRPPDRRGEQGLQARDDDPRPHAPRRGGDGHRHRARGVRVRHELLQGARPVRRADRDAPGRSSS